MESEIFQIEEEIASELCEVDDDELRCFAELHENPSNDEQTELFIFACFQMFKRTRAPEWAQRASVQTDVWIASTPLSDNQAARRYRIAKLIFATASEYGCHIEGVPDCRHKNAMDLLEGARYHATNQLDILNETIEFTASTLNQMPPTAPQKPGLSMQLAKLSAERYEKTDNVHDLQVAIQIAESVTAIEVVDPQIQAQWLCRLGTWMRDKFDREHDPQDLDRAMDTFQRALSHPFQSDILRAGLCLDLGNLQIRRFEWSRKGEDLDEAFSTLKAVLENSSVDQSLRVVALSRMAVSSIMKYMHTEEDGDMNLVIASVGMALESTPSDSSERVGLLSLLGCMLDRLNESYERTGRLVDLDRAIEVIELVVRDGNGSQVDLSAWFRNLGLWLMSRFDNTQSKRDLDRSIEILEFAAKSPTQGSVLCDLSNQYARRYDYQGDRADLDRAIELAEQAVDIPDVSSLAFGILGSHLLRRFHDTVRRADLDSGHRALVEASKNIPSTDPNWPRLRANLAYYYALLFNVTKNLDDLNRAIDILSAVLERCPENHPARISLLRELAVSLERRCRGNFHLHKIDVIRTNIMQACVHQRMALGFQYTNDLSDIDKAIGLLNVAIENIDAQHLEWAHMHDGLARCFVQRYFMTLSQTGPTHDTLVDLSHAIDHCEIALNALPDHHRPMCGLRLGQYLDLRFQQASDEEDRQRSAERYREAWECRSAVPGVHIVLARIVASSLSENSEHQKAAHILEEAVQLLPGICPKFLSDADKQYQLQGFYGLASEAAAASLCAGKSASHALEVLETGRGVMASLLLDMRTELSELRQKHPDLAQKFETIRDELNSGQATDDLSAMPSTFDHRQPKTGQANRQHLLHQEFEQLMQKIRDQVGFSRFLLAPTAHETMAAAQSGPIVVINISRRRCDAIIIESKRIKALPLQEITAADVEKKSSMLTVSNPFATQSHVHLSPLLEWLWEVAAKPILEDLGITQPPSRDDDWPHIWWVLTGGMTNMPLHAAGYHDERTHETVIDRVISSYSTSVKSLIRSRQRSVSQIPRATTTQHALLTNMAETPNQTSLPFASEEVAAIQPVCKEMDLTPIEGPKRTDEILEHLHSCKIFHFAGHGLSDAGDPTRSCLLTEDWETNPLTVDKLRQQHLQETGPFLAYLSACSTVSNKEADLLDKGIHLISAIQLAGFRHAIGALWEVSDPHCVDMARIMYETLQAEDMTDEAVARGVHRGIRMLRDGGRKERATIDDRSDLADNNDDLMHELEKGFDDLDIMTDTTDSAVRGKRDAVPVGSRRRRQQQESSLFWIPFVHYGP